MILALSFLQALSFHGAEALLLEERYIKENRIEKDDEAYDKKFFYPYCLYDNKGKMLDCIYYIEYCKQVMDDEYADGCMTWEAEKIEWKRQI